MMSEVQGLNEVEVTRGPGWLFVHVPRELHDVDEFAEQILELIDTHFVYRVVLEMDDVTFLPSMLMAQLVRLQKRLLQHDGALRLSGLSPECLQALHFCRLDHTLAHFDNLTDAVHGCETLKPR